MVTSYSRYGIYCFLAGLAATANAAENKAFGLRSALENKNSPMNFTKQHRNLSLFTAVQIGADIDGLPNANAGHAVALQCAGTNPMLLAVGSPYHLNNNGMVRTWEYDGSTNTWTQVGGTLSEDPEYYGFSVSLSLDGSKLAVGAVIDWDTLLGETRVYKMVGGVWTQMGATLTGIGPWNMFGKSIRLSDDGNRLVCGSPRGFDSNGDRTGVVKVFEWDGNNFVQMGPDVVGSENGDIFGDAVSISGDGSTIVVGAKFGSNDAGHVRVYKWNGSIWDLIGDIDGVAADDCYGFSVDIDKTGKCIAASSIGSDDPADKGYVNSFKYDGSSWMQMGSTLYEEASGDQFGFAVSLSDDCRRLAVGASRNDGMDSNLDPVINNGHVRVYDFVDSEWVKSYADIDGENAGDKSGAAVSLGNNGMCLAIGAPVNNNGDGHTRVYDLPFAPGTVQEAEGGGDPHFKRWNQENRNTFHGECDLVVVHSESFHNVGFDMHVRTTIQDFFSYIEAAAVKLGEDIVEVENGNLKLNGVDHSDADLPLVFGGEQKYTLYKYSEDHRNDGSVLRRTYRLTLEDDTEIEFRFYKKFMTYKIIGHPQFADSVGLMGQYPTGAMLSRDGVEMQDFVQFGFEWQVGMTDPVLFADARSPQLPYEQCRMPTAAQSAIRRLKSGNRKLMEAAQEACAAGSKLSDHNVQLCVDDVMMTGDLEMAGEW